LFFDFGTIAFITFPAVLYYAFLPSKLIGSLFDRIFIWFFTALVTFILVLTFFSEITFWDEFKTRFNFIAVDYLIYTHEVIANIEESYPIPLLTGGVAFITIAILILFYKKNAFTKTFTSTLKLKQRLTLLIVSTISCLFFAYFVTNNQAE
jgi:hypothetical protein